MRLVTNSIITNIFPAYEKNPLFDRYRYLDDNLEKALLQVVETEGSILTPMWLSRASYMILSLKISEELRKDPNLKKYPEMLQESELAYVLARIFGVKNIRLSYFHDSTLLGLYVSSSLNKGLLPVIYGMNNVAPQDQKNLEGVYLVNEQDIKKLIYLFCTKPTIKYIDEVYNQLTLIAPTVYVTNDPNRILLKNGIYDRRLKQVLSFDPSYIALTKIPVNYVENAKNPIISMPDGKQWDVDSWIDDLFEDPEISCLMWQVFADVLQPNISRNKAIWFYSESGNNGKGTIGQLIKNLVGPANFASLAVDDFSREFALDTLIGKAVNIADENDVNVYIDSVKNYKASITGDTLFVNRKYEKPIGLVFTGTNIQMMNGLPKTRDKSGSFYRRIIPVPFVKSFTNNGERPYIKNEYIKRQDVLEYVLWKAIQLRFNEFIEPKASRLLLESYKESNDSVVQFWNEFSHEFQWDGLPSQFLFDLYMAWFKRNNPFGKAVNKSNFLDSLRNLLINDHNWESRIESSQSFRSSPRMDADEPLITEYQLVNWYNKQCLSGVDELKRRFPRKQVYRGIIRKVH